MARVLPVHCGLWCCLAAVLAAADDPPKRNTHRVEPGPIQVKTSVDGLFESAEMHEIMLRPKAWTTYEVVKAVRPGTAVRKGEQLVWFVEKEIDEAIQDQETTVALARLDLQVARLDLAVKERELPHEMESIEIALKLAREAYEDYERIDKPYNIRSIEFSEKSVDYQVEYAAEELAQLEKMYKADDITEETEELILKRTRRELESAKFYAESNRNYITRAKRLLQYDDRTQRAALRQAEAAAERARLAVPADLEKARSQFAKSETALKKAVEHLEHLKRDKEAMKILAPADGIVFYGQQDRGAFQPANYKLLAGEAFPTGVPAMTIVGTRPLFIRSSVGEADLAKLKAGLGGKAVPTAFPQLRVPATVETVGAVPFLPGMYDVRISVSLSEAHAAIVPTMTCKVNFVTYYKPDALTVPDGAVFTDPIDDELRYVYVALPEEKHEKRTVKVGVSTGGKTEILEGVRSGDELLLEDPTAKK